VIGDASESTAAVQPAASSALDVISTATTSQQQQQQQQPHCDDRLAGQTSRVITRRLHLLRFVVDLLYNLLYNKSSPQQIENLQQIRNTLYNKFTFKIEGIRPRHPDQLSLAIPPWVCIEYWRWLWAPLGKKR